MRRRRSTRGVPQSRLRVGFVLIAMVLSVFGARLVQLQGVDPGSYAAMAAAEGTVEVVLPAERGDILDRNGEPLADSVDGLMVVADPAQTADDAPAIARFLAERLSVDYIDTLARLRGADKESRFEYIARRVPSTLANDVLEEAEARDIEGLSTRRDPVRTYPAHDVAANLIGFMGTDEAFGGLEQVFDKHLSGTDGSARYEVGGGNKIPLGSHETTDAVDGADLTTTIDRDLQWFTQRVLRDAVRKAGGESGVALILDSRTGEVLADADYPTFDAANPADYETEDRGARSINLAYEPGSVQKVLTLASLIDAGRMTARTEFTVPGRLDRQDRPIRDYFEHGTLRLTLAGILAKSSNIGTVLAADRFKPGEMRSYLEAFGLGRRTDVGLESESPGILPDPALWTEQAEDRIAFGQSLSVTPIQMAAAVNTIANDGVRVAPSLIKGTAVRDDGVEIGTGVAATRRVVSSYAAHQTTLMMERVVDPEDGVAPKAQVPGYRVAGKTGTAQRVGAECGCYDGTFTVSFGGFAPAEDPRFTIYVAIHDPDTGGGGSVAGPVFSQLMGFTLHRYGVAASGKKGKALPVTW
ncbi:penicillin-binding protein 2 [Nocardioides sp.]|uniref:peptidoglycan D,D-transpeptidase FtsI family protein n=1 Tax=Nocardioides sp. TaxID=35761 RepID=UPI0025E88F91|nr:penicillin-binding protein 2 [Nocardioides sp.]